MGRLISPILPKATGHVKTGGVFVRWMGSRVAKGLAVDYAVVRFLSGLVRQSRPRPVIGEGVAHGGRAVL